MKTENSLCIHESSLLLVSCKYLYKHLSPTEDSAESEADFLGSIPLARARCLPWELPGSLRDGSLQSSNDAVWYGLPIAHSN